MESHNMLSAYKYYFIEDLALVRCFLRTTVHPDEFMSSVNCTHANLVKKLNWLTPEKFWPAIYEFTGIGNESYSFVLNDTTSITVSRFHVSIHESMQIGFEYMTNRMTVTYTNANGTKNNDENKGIYDEDMLLAFLKGSNIPMV